MFIQICKSAPHSVDCICILSISTSWLQLTFRKHNGNIIQNLTMTYYVFFRNRIKLVPKWIRIIVVLVKSSLLCCLFDTLEGRHNQRVGVSNHQPHYCLLNLLSRRSSEKTSKLCVTGLCAENSPVTGEFPTQRASNAELFSFDDVIMNES